MSFATAMQAALKEAHLTPAEIRGILVTWESEYTGHVAYISAAPSHKSAYSRARKYAQYWAAVGDQFHHIPELAAVADLYRVSFLTSAYYEHKKVLSKARTLTEDIWETAAVVGGVAAVAIIGPGAILGAAWDGFKAVFSPLLGGVAKEVVPGEEKPEMFPEVPPELLGEEDDVWTYRYEDVLSGEKKKAGPGLLAGLAGLLGKAATVGGEIFKAKAATKRTEGIGGIVSEVGSILLILVLGVVAALVLYFLLR